jgi:hypothetical protein
MTNADQAAVGGGHGWFSSPRGIAAQWLGLLAGPVAWAVDLTASYSLVKWTCGSQHTSVLHLIDFAAVIVIAAGAWASWTALRAAPGAARLDGGAPFDRGRFMAILGLVVCALFLAAIVAAEVPRLVLDACT